MQMPGPRQSPFLCGAGLGVRRNGRLGFGFFSRRAARVCVCVRVRTCVFGAPRPRLKAADVVRTQMYTVFVTEHHSREQAEEGKAGGRQSQRTRKISRQDDRKAVRRGVRCDERRREKQMPWMRLVVHATRVKLSGVEMGRFAEECARSPTFKANPVTAGKGCARISWALLSSLASRLAKVFLWHTRELSGLSRTDQGRRPGRTLSLCMRFVRFSWGEHTGRRVLGVMTVLTSRCLVRRKCKARKEPTVSANGQSV